MNEWNGDPYQSFLMTLPIPMRKQKKTIKTRMIILKAILDLRQDPNLEHSIIELLGGQMTSSDQDPLLQQNSSVWSFDGRNQFLL